MSRKRILLLAVAGLLSVSALLAIGILLVGRFGGTEGRILGTTALLAGYSLVALPAVVLLDQGRARALALWTAAAAATAAGVALAGIWSRGSGDTLGRSVATATLIAVASAQVSALTARRAERDPELVRRLYAASCGSALVLACAGSALIWANPHGSLWPRLYGALVVLDLLLVALQPILARARPAGPAHDLRVVLESGASLDVTIEGGELAAAAAKAIRTAERSGARVARLEVRRGAARRGT